MVDADGAVLGIYRKSHIPDGPGYTEKYYFNPRRHRLPRVGHARTPPSASASAGTSGSPSRRGRWRCSAPRCCFYPTAIGSEPPDPTWDSSGHWQRVMQGHAGANLMPLVAANRVGHEVGTTTEITFYGSSFIADATGAKVAEADRDGEAVLTATFDLDELRAATRTRGACSATAGPTCTARCSRSTASTPTGA